MTDELALFYPTVQMQKQPKYHLRYSYGMEMADLDKLLEIQNFECAICRGKFSDLSRRVAMVDHNHFTGTIRGLLCRTCNLGLGQFQDSPALLLLAAAYLTDPPVPKIKDFKPSYRKKYTRPRRRIDKPIPPVV